MPQTINQYGYNGSHLGDLSPSRISLSVKKSVLANRRSSSSATGTRTCQYYTRIGNNGSITRQNTTHFFYMIMHGNCQINNLIFCLEYNICHIKYVGQTNNRIPDRFQGNFSSETTKTYCGKAFG